MDNPVAVAIIGAFPQMLLMFYAPLGLVGDKTPLKSLVVPALLLTVVVSVTRSVPELFGWHIPIFLIAYLVVAMVFRLTSFIAALASAALSFILVALGDVIIALPILKLYDLSFESAMENLWVHSAFLWLEAVFLLAAAFVVRYKSFVLIPIARGNTIQGRSGDRR